MTSTQHDTHRSAQPPTGVSALRTACDQLIAATPNPNATRALIVRVWAAGAATADDLLTDLITLAADHAAHRGEQMSTADLLNALGRSDAAAQFRAAVQDGLDSHREFAAEVARTASAVDAARAAARTAVVRLLQTAQHRHAGDVHAAQRTPLDATGRRESGRAVQGEASSLALHA